jgi:predicted branched-subunit amino acid permease
VLGAGYIGYGAFASDVHLSLAATVLSTLVIWALPGQLVMLEMMNAGAPAFAIVSAVALTAMRFLPMTVSLLPSMRAADQPRGPYFLAAHLLAMTGWALAMQRFPSLPMEQRLSYFVGLALCMMAGSSVAAALGFLLADNLNPLLKLGFVFMNPLYFVLILTGDIRGRTMALALAAGAILGPLAYLLTPQWSVLAAGLLGGTIAFALSRHKQ